MSETFITPQEFAEKMAEFAKLADRDVEEGHDAADKLMCLVLKQMGYEEGVKVFEDMTKYYS